MMNDGQIDAAIAALVRLESAVAALAAARAEIAQLDEPGPVLRRAAKHAEMAHLSTGDAIRALRREVLALQLLEPTE